MLKIRPIRLKSVENVEANLPAPPDDLSPRSQRPWADVVADWDRTPEQLALLEEACRALDRSTVARVIVDTEGAVVWDRFRQPKAHPLLSVERDQRGLFARLLRELGLDSSPCRIANRRPSGDGTTTRSAGAQEDRRPPSTTRRLEGIERMNAEIEIQVGPSFWGDADQERKVAREHIELCRELREEMIASGRDLAYHWCYRALELGTPPSLFLDEDDDAPRSWGASEDEWPAQRAAMFAEEERKAVIVRGGWDALRGVS